MAHLDTLLQIKSGFWAIEPNFGLSLRDTVLKILSKSPNEAMSKDKLEARHYLIDGNGKKYTSKSINEAPSETIGIIHITGAMIKYGNYYCWGSDELVAQAEIFDKNPNIVGQIWIMDSGGGAVNAVAPYIDFLSRKTKPVISLCDTSASANYWVASATDYIMADNDISASFGSIGIVANIRSAKKYWQKLGVIDHTIYSDKSEFKNKAFDLALEGKYKLIKKEHLNPFAEKFQEHVKNNRPNLQLDVEGIISGKVFYAEKSVKIGLADSIGNLQQAIKKVNELAAVQNFMSN